MKKEKKQVKTIRTPKFPAVVFLANALITLLSAFGGIVLPLITESTKKQTPREIIADLILGSVTLFIAILLFKRRYNKTLIYASLIFLLAGIFTTTQITFLSVGDILFDVIFTGFVYVMIQMPETPIRERFVKFRFAIPVYMVVHLIVSVIQAGQMLSEILVNKSGTEIPESVSMATAVIPSYVFLPHGIIMVMCYALLTNWLADPYKDK